MLMEYGFIEAGHLLISHSLFEFNAPIHDHRLALGDGAGEELFASQLPADRHEKYTQSQLDHRFNLRPVHI